MIPKRKKRRWLSAAYILEAPDTQWTLPPTAMLHEIHLFPPSAVLYIHIIILFISYIYIYIIDYYSIVMSQEMAGWGLSRPKWSSLQSKYLDLGQAQQPSLPRFLAVDPSCLQALQMRSCCQMKLEWSCLQNRQTGATHFAACPARELKEANRESKVPGKADATGLVPDVFCLLIKNWIYWILVIIVILQASFNHVASTATDSQHVRETRFPWPFFCQANTEVSLTKAIHLSFLSLETQTITNPLSKLMQPGHICWVGKLA